MSAKGFMTKGVLSVGGLGLGGHHTTKKFIVRRLQLHYEMRCITEQMLSIEIQRPRSVIRCLRRCICPKSVVNAFHAGVAMASRSHCWRAQWTNRRMKESMSYCLIQWFMNENKSALKFVIFLYEIRKWNL